MRHKAASSPFIFTFFNEKKTLKSITDSEKTVGKRSNDFFLIFFLFFSFRRFLCYYLFLIVRFEDYFMSRFSSHLAHSTPRFLVRYSTRSSYLNSIFTHCQLVCTFLCICARIYALHVCA